jgi:hypothetical protein
VTRQQPLVKCDATDTNEAAARMTFAVIVCVRMLVNLLAVNLLAVSDRL